MSFIITPLRWVIDLLYGWVGDYAVAIILFTLFVKLILLPLDLKQRSSMRRMTDLQPKIDAINKKYDKDPEKRNMKTMELYKKERVNPMMGCLPMLIQMPILFAMFAVMRHIADEQIILMFQTVQSGAPLELQSFFWISNIWQPDNITATIIPLANSLAAVREIPGNQIVTQAAIDAMRANYDVVMGPVMEVYNNGVANGWAILPLVAGVSQFFSSKLMQPANAAKTQQQGMQKAMNYLFPLMSVFFCWQYNAAFALYWVTSNVYIILQYWLFNLYADYRKKKQEEAAYFGPQKEN